jgi:hypothetical protein
LRHEALFKEAPQRDRQFTRNRNDHDPSDTPALPLYERGHCQALSSFAFALSFVRPRRRLSSAPTVDFRRRRAQKLSKSAVALAIEAHFDVSRPRLDSFEHGGRLDDRGPKERSVVEFLPLLSLFASGPCRLRVQRRCPMARAMIASAYIRQLRSGLPLCCMHGQSRR